MRFLNKLYSFLRSIYLNDSKFTNNLRHALIIFFQREFKTINNLKLFGALFQSSKWSDYQTCNVNKSFRKTCLSSFIYLLAAVLLIFFLMGRSKSEQYLGFLPFFSYINFFMGFIPLLFHDLWFQVLFTAYVFYLFILSWSTKLINKLSLNLFYSLSSKKTTKSPKKLNTGGYTTLEKLNTMISNLINADKTKLDRVVDYITIKLLPENPINECAWEWCCCCSTRHKINKSEQNNNYNNYNSSWSANDPNSLDVAMQGINPEPNINNYSAPMKPTQSIIPRAISNQQSVNTPPNLEIGHISNEFNIEVGSTSMISDPSNHYKNPKPTPDHRGRVPA